jgi:hypothetical protein
VKLNLVEGIDTKRPMSGSNGVRSTIDRNSSVSAQDVLQMLLEFALVMYKNYFENPYHSFHHAIDVTYFAYYLMEDMSLAEQLDLTPSDKAVLLISALGHDVLHPGTNNLYQVYFDNEINAKTPVALRYNNESVLENQSADFVKDLLEQLPVLESLSLEMPVTKDIHTQLISRIKECILKTDMCHYFSMLEQVIEVVEITGYICITRSYYNVSPGGNTSASGSSHSPQSIRSISTNLTPLHIQLAMSSSPGTQSPKSPKPKVHEFLKQHAMAPLSRSSSFTSMTSLNKLPLSKVQKEYMIQNILHAAGNHC